MQTIGFLTVTAINDATAQAQNNAVLSVVLGLMYRSLESFHETKTRPDPSFFQKLDGLFDSAAQYDARTAAIVETLESERKLSDACTGTIIGDVIEYLRCTSGRLTTLTHKLRSLVVEDR